MTKSKIPAVSAKNKPVEKSSPEAKVSPMSKINPISYLRRERTFDISLMQNERNEKAKQKFSPQLQSKKIAEPPKVPEKKQYFNRAERMAPPLARSTTSTTSAFQDELLNAAKRRSIAVTSTEKMKTIDKPFKKPLNSELKKSNSAITSSTSSLTASLKSMKSSPAKEQVSEVKMQPVVEQVIVETEEPIVKHESPKNNFYFGMNDKNEEKLDEVDHNVEIEDDAEQMDAINRFAEDIFKTTNGGKYLTQGNSLKKL